VFELTPPDTPGAPAKIRCRRKSRMSCPNASPACRGKPASGSDTWNDHWWGMIGRR